MADVSSHQHKKMNHFVYVCDTVSAVKIVYLPVISLAMNGFGIIALHVFRGNAMYLIHQA